MCCRIEISSRAADFDHSGGRLCDRGRQVQRPHDRLESVGSKWHLICLKIMAGKPLHALRCGARGRHPNTSKRHGHRSSEAPAESLHDHRIHGQPALPRGPELFLISGNQSDPFNTSANSRGLALSLAPSISRMSTTSSSARMTSSLVSCVLKSSSCS